MCAAEATAVEGDTKAKALANCATTNHCQGDCCLCGATCTGANFEMGKCKAEVNAAVGIANPSALFDGMTIKTDCMDSTMSCGKATALGACLVTNCMSACMPTVCM